MPYEDKNPMYGAVPLSNLRSGGVTGGDYGAMTPPISSLDEQAKDPMDLSSGGVGGYADTEAGDTASTLSSHVPHGIAKVEAAQAVWTSKTRWILFGALACASYVYSLDGVTTYQYLSYATSYVFLNSVSGTITTASAIIIAVGKPAIAKLADVFGRAETFIIVAILYAVGYICIASAQGLAAIAGGQIVYSFGYTGLQIMLQLIIADSTTLRFRGLVSACVSAPFIINNFVAAEIAQGVLPNWRWGYGMFAILVPVCLSPIVIALLWAQRKARRMHKLNTGSALKLQRTSVIRSITELDLVGLILVALSLALILLPLTLAAAAKNGWRNASMIAMIVVGVILFPIFLFYESRVPRNPIVPFAFLKNKSILGACLIGFFDFVSFYLQFTNQYNFVYVTRDWSYRYLSYFSSTQSLSLTIFGILAGAVMAKTRDVKWILFFGLCVRLLGVGIMIHSRGANGTTAELVINQVLQGLGGGFAATALQVSAQADVTHAQVATVTAMVLLITEVGNSVGSAIATAVYTNTMPGELAAHVPSNNATLINELYQSVTLAASYPIDSPIRQGVIAAYEAVMFRQVLAATCVAVLPPLFCLWLIKPVRLEDVQNVRDGKDLAGKPTGRVADHRDE